MIRKQSCGCRFLLLRDHHFFLYAIQFICRQTQIRDQHILRCCNILHTSGILHCGIQIGKVRFYGLFTCTGELALHLDLQTGFAPVSILGCRYQSQRRIGTSCLIICHRCFQDFFNRIRHLIPGVGCQIICVFIFRPGWIRSICQYHLRQDQHQ